MAFSRCIRLTFFRYCFLFFGGCPIIFRGLAFPSCAPAQFARSHGCAEVGGPIESTRALLQHASSKGQLQAIDATPHVATLQAHTLQHDLAQSRWLSSIFEWLSGNVSVEPGRMPVAAGSEPTNQPIIAQLFSHFRICANCDHFERLGEAFDGGYLTCMDHDGLIGAFSLGVEKHDQWSTDVVTKLGAQTVSQFDCTIKHPPVRCAGCVFYKKCIRGASQVGTHDTESWTLKEAIKHAGFSKAAKDTLIMKMDIEGSEWDILKEFSNDDLEKFQQIIVEFHGLHVESRHENYLKSLETLRRNHLVPVHLHGNNFAGMYTVGKYQLPRVLEVTFIKSKGAHNKCLADQQYHQLDAPNSQSDPELPLAHLTPT